MNIEQIESEIKDTVLKFPFVSKTETVSMTKNTIKIRMSVTDNCFIQIYRNIEKNITSYAVVIGRNRIYGRDCDGGVWHKHPLEDPDTHNFNQNGMREVELSEFLMESQSLLKKIGVI